VRTGRSQEGNEILSEEVEIFVSHIASEPFEFLSDVAVFCRVTSKVVIDDFGVFNAMSIFSTCVISDATNIMTAQKYQGSHP